MDRFDPFVKYADVYGDIINWEKDPMNKPQNQNKYFFSDGKTYYEQICKMLRLMSVFKEAFNQIYSNEDEISEAWENFVNNLSASVVEGSEPDVTLTWTDDSVNFEFTMVPGVPGEQGVGITSISFNSDYTMTITLSDGNTYTSMSLKGETGPQGPQGETGSGLQILDVYATLADLQSAHPTGEPGDAYQVGSAGSYTLYIWSSSQSAWVPAGSLGTVSPSLSNPLMDGTASAGSLDQYSRGDHVHPTDTSRASKAELDVLIKTSQALIDQSFTYRESPAIQDGLARIDKIKGNTLNWNQLAENGNFDSATGWGGNNSSIAVANNVLTGTVTTSHATTGLRKLGGISFIANHKYLVSAVMSCSVASDYCVARFYATGYDFRSDALTITANTKKRQVWILTPTSSFTGDAYIYPKYSYPEPLSVGDTFTFEKVMLIDLTQMFGAGNEPSTVEEFTSLFGKSYYDYCQGAMLSFGGRNVKFNQLVQNGNFADTSNWSAESGATLSISNNIATVSSTTANNGIRQYFSNALTVGHKYLIKADFNVPTEYRCVIGTVANQGVQIDKLISTANTWTEVIGIGTCTASTTAFYCFVRGTTYENVNVRNVMCFDLTEMFGAGNEPSVEGFKELFPNDFYEYNIGQYMNLGQPVSLKTVGKNLFDGVLQNGMIDQYGREQSQANRYRSGFIRVLPSTRYVISVDGVIKNVNIFYYDINKNFISSIGGSLVTTPSDCAYMRFYYDQSILNANLQLEMLKSGNNPTLYEPYTSSTLSLPISTYFPNGMDGVGSDYDELTNTKATTRMARVDLGTLDYVYEQQNSRFYTLGLSNVIKKQGQYDLPNIIVPNYTVRYVYQISAENNMSVGVSHTSGAVFFSNANYTSGTDFKTAMSGVYLVYPLATPTETAVDLDLDFMAYEDGTEQLLPVNGSVPSTSPVIADMTYLSIDDAMAYILEKLESIPEQTEQRLEALEDDVADLQTDVGALQPAVSALQTSVGNINTNIGQLSSTVAGHTASISDIQSDITDLNTDLGDLEDTVTDNTSRIGTLETGLSTTNGNVQSLSSQVQSIDGRVTNLESDLFKVVVKEFDYDSVASESNFGTTTPITQEEGYRVIGVVGTEAQAGEYTSPASNIAITQCHIYYTSLGALTITIFGRNTGASTRTNVRIYAYLLCIKDIQ